MATCRPRMRSEGSPARVAANAPAPTAAASASGHGPPWPPTLRAVKAPTPRKAACASESCPDRATRMSSPSAAIAVAATPTRTESRTGDNVHDQATTSAAAATPAARPGRTSRSTGRSQQTLRPDNESGDHQRENGDVRRSSRTHLPPDDGLEHADQEAADDRAPHRIEPTDHRTGQRA